MKKQEDQIKVLSARNQILTRPQMWIGSMDPTEMSSFFFNEGKLKWQTISYIPAFLKIINEVLDNSIDAINNSKVHGDIKVNMNEESIEIIDTGPGIPILKKDIQDIDKTLPEETRQKIANSYLPETCWTQLFTGSNFDDAKEQATIGSHGVGSKACSIFSTKFVGTTYNNGKKCVVSCKDNMDKVTTKVSDYNGQSGTKVVFYPDFARFKLTKIEPVYFTLIEQRLNCLSVMFPNISFYFNRKKIRYNDKSFIKSCNENIVFQVFENGFIGVFPNEQDEFNFMTYVNGLHLSRGGAHIDYASIEISNRIRDKLVKKFKNIRPGDIKQKLTLVLFLKNFNKPKYDSQTKEILTNSISEVHAQLKNTIDFDELAKKILRNEAIIGPIVETFKIKEELKARQEIKKVKRVKISAEKYMPPIGEQKNLFLCEGLSALAGISACLGRSGNGYYGCRGVGINAYSQSVQKISANAELKDIVNILELDLFGQQENKTISYDKIVIANDADLDGNFISSIFVGWFKRFAPNLFKEGKVCKLITPIVILKDSKNNIKHYFFQLNEFKKWEAKNPDHKFKVEYLKGLGSIEKDDLNKIIELEGVDSLIKVFELDEGSDKVIDDWLGDNSEPRKEYLRNYDFDINLA